MGERPPKDAKETLVKGADSIKTLEPREVGLGGRSMNINGTGENELAHGR